MEVGGQVLGDGHVAGGREPVEADGEDGHHDGAMTNGGRARSPKVPVVATLSKGRLGRREVIRARGMATAKAMTWEMTMSSRSMGQPVAMMWVTDSWLR